jgi:AraC-like DNA-binding protein
LNIISPSFARRWQSAAIRLERIRQSCDHFAVEYRERPPPAALEGLVKAFWTLDAAGRGDSWIEHEATPDGCIELIMRLAGQSRWGSLQPERFVVGLSDAPIAFEISGDAKFAAIRLWPWTWRALSDAGPEALFGRWAAVQDPRLTRLLDFPCDADSAEAALLEMLGPETPRLQRFASAILQSHSVSEVGRRMGMRPRQLQRWFAEHVGLPPRSYLRLLRFQQAFEELPNADLLAHHAADHGFADQAHMAREFRRLAGQAASRAKPRSRGPFLS